MWAPANKWHGPRTGTYRPIASKKSLEKLGNIEELIWLSAMKLGKIFCGDQSFKVEDSVLVYLRSQVCPV